MKKKKIGLLPKIVIAIALGIACGLFFPGWLVRIFLTINGLFSNFLGFIIPLLILVAATKANAITVLHTAPKSTVLFHTNFWRRRSM